MRPCTGAPPPLLDNILPRQRSAFGTSKVRRKGASERHVPPRDVPVLYPNGHPQLQRDHQHSNHEIHCWEQLRNSCQLERLADLC